MCDKGQISVPISHSVPKLVDPQLLELLVVNSKVYAAARAGEPAAKAQSLTLTSASAPTLSTQAAAAPASTKLPDTDDERRQLSARVFRKFDRYPGGGLQLNDEEELKRQRGIVWELVKIVGNRISEGMELRDIGLPIGILEPRSFLECMTPAWCFGPTYLARAAACTDPMERFVLTMTFAISGMHLSAGYRKPFNPILGETYQAEFHDGTQVFMEQISHHPPISAWQMVGTKNSYVFWGRGEGSANHRGNSLRGFQHGPNVVDFPDGGRITWNLPILVVNGVAWGDRVQHFEGTLEFRDDVNNISCDVVFNAEALGFVRSLFSKQKQPTDYLRGDVLLGAGKNRKKVGSLEGSWLGFLQFGGKSYWDYERDMPHVLRPVDGSARLPSDCTQREDIVALAKGDDKSGTEIKQALEERQRYEKRLRQAAKAKRQASSKH